jgi:hypothetical protein
MLFIKITLNNKKVLLLIDTGASKSLLDINKSKKYNFNYLKFKEERFFGIGGFQEIYIVYDYKIDEYFIRFLGTDLSKIIPILNKDDNDIIGVVGSDFFNDNKVVIDYNLMKMYIME